MNASKAENILKECGHEVKKSFEMAKIVRLAEITNIDQDTRKIKAVAKINNGEEKENVAKNPVLYIPWFQRFSLLLKMFFFSICRILSLLFKFNDARKKPLVGTVDNLTLMPPASDECCQICHFFVS